MNQRIQELADQVGLGTQHNGIVLTKNVNAARAFEQFALLIVRECARIVPNTDLEDVDGGDSAVLRAASAQIKKHFGVE